MTKEKFIDHLEEIGDLAPYKVVIIKCFDEHYIENQRKEYILHELICCDELEDLWIWENDWYEGQEYDIVGYYNINDININCCAVHKLQENKDFGKGTDHENN
jgi:hypothetical protein